MRLSISLLFFLSLANSILFCEDIFSIMLMESNSLSEKITVIDTAINQNDPEMNRFILNLYDEEPFLLSYLLENGWKKSLSLRWDFAHANKDSLLFLLNNMNNFDNSDLRASLFRYIAIKENPQLIFVDQARRVQTLITKFHGDLPRYYQREVARWFQSIDSLDSVVREEIIQIYEKSTNRWLNDEIRILLNL